MNYVSLYLLIMRPDQRGIRPDRSARARSRDWLSSADVFGSSLVRVGGCKYERYVWYIITYEHQYLGEHKK